MWSDFTESTTNILHRKEPDEHPSENHQVLSGAFSSVPITDSLPGMRTQTRKCCAIKITSQLESARTLTFTGINCNCFVNQRKEGLLLGVKVRCKTGFLIVLS